MSRLATGVLAGAVLAMIVATSPAQASSKINAYRFKATARAPRRPAATTKTSPSFRVR